MVFCHSSVNGSQVWGIECGFACRRSLAGFIVHLSHAFRPHRPRFLYDFSVEDIDLASGGDMLANLVLGFPVSRLESFIFT